MANNSRKRHPKPTPKVQNKNDKQPSTMDNKEICQICQQPWIKPNKNEFQESKSQNEQSKNIAEHTGIG